jgi:sec-independent protein translocase protein TatA
MPDIGAPELVIVLFIVLLVFGPSRLPEAGAALGRAIREFRQSLQEGGEQRPSQKKQANTDHASERSISPLD